jgi:hypothetical protein
VLDKSEGLWSESKHWKGIWRVERTAPRILKLCELHGEGAHDSENKAFNPLRWGHFSAQGDETRILRAGFETREEHLPIRPRQQVQQLSLTSPGCQAAGMPTQRPNCFLSIGQSQDRPLPATVLYPPASGMNLLPSSKFCSGLVVATPASYLGGSRVRISVQRPDIVTKIGKGQRHEDVLGEWRYSSTPPLTSALDGGEWSASCPGRFIPRERLPPVPTG